MNDNLKQRKAAKDRKAETDPHAAEVEIRRLERRLNGPKPLGDREKWVIRQRIVRLRRVAAGLDVRAKATGGLKRGRLNSEEKLKLKRYTAIDRMRVRLAREFKEKQDKEKE